MTYNMGDITDGTVGGLNHAVPGSNAHEFTVSELSGAVKRSLEDQFGRVRVRGEIGRVSRPSSGHIYFDLKDDRSVLAAVTWKGQAAKLAHAQGQHFQEWSFVQAFINIASPQTGSGIEKQTAQRLLSWAEDLIDRRP